tara:strand:+ start:26 stop:373 length:348 start_codon:yes stop_codon:yes gene_type:complete
MEFKGTKGEWVVKDLVSGLETEIFCGKIRIAQSKHYNNGKEGDENYFKNDPLEKEGVENAKLIAAAPELLDALKVFVNFPKEDLEGWIDEGAPVTMTVQSADLYKALNAINKALN